MTATELCIFEADTGRWRVRVRYPGAEPHTLMSLPTRAEADRAARGYAVRYGWRYEPPSSARKG